ncbi:MAG TPA: glycine cleavage system protein GcvH [Balneolaceae bacterium]|nr:glycine cleavage system protein GcvH [Balneolaceae bacterium]
MENPTDLKYTSNHEWIRETGDETATVGITDFAQGELGDIVFVELEQPGFEAQKDDRMGTIEAVKTVSDIFAPVSGEIIAINEQLEEEPELVNDDPYGDGWMIKIKISHPAELEELMTPKEYEDLIR